MEVGLEPDSSEPREQKKAGSESCRPFFHVSFAPRRPRELIATRTRLKNQER
jgi:hypothetical protein